MKRLFVAAAAAVLVTAGVFAENVAVDVRNASDYPLIKRYPGAVISHYARLENDAYDLPLGPMKNGRPERTKKLVGRVFRIAYDSPEKWSTIDTFNGFARVLKKAGFKVLFSASGHRLANTDEWTEHFYKNCFYLQGSTKEQRFLSAKLSGADGDIYATLYVSLGWYTHAVARLDVIEVGKEAL